MIAATGFTVYALGVRHGADPDHLAAIDNLTRSSAARRPRLSQFTGTLFALGHTVMVVAIAALVGIAGSRFTAHHAAIEAAGTWISIVVLLALATANIAGLLRGRSTGVAGLTARLIPRSLRLGTSAFAAMAVGFLFGFGFETSSQIITYTLAFGAGDGVLGALAIAAFFCLGMVTTDTADSLIVNRLVSGRSARTHAATAAWTWTVSALAVAVAAYEFTAAIGRPLPISELAASGAIVGALALAFLWIIVSTRHQSTSAARRATPGEESS